MADDPISPERDDALIAKLAAMTDRELAAVLDKARGTSDSADWRAGFAAKTARLRELMNPRG